MTKSTQKRVAVLTAEKERTPTVNAQRKYLTERLDQTGNRWGHARRKRERTPDPAPVVAARKLLANYDKQCSKEDAEYEVKYTSARRVVEKAILFSDPEAALEALEAFEKTWGRTDGG